jgi:hypothetical protein
MDQEGTVGIAYLGYKTGPMGILERRTVHYMGDPVLDLLADPSSWYAPVEDLTISVAGNSIILRWSPVEGAVEFYVYRSDSAFGEFSPLATVSGSETSFTDTYRASAARASFYLVTAVCLSAP